MPTIDELNDRLRQCRRLYDSVLDAQTRDSLTAHAADLEAQIAEAENAEARATGDVRTSEE